MDFRLPEKIKEQPKTYLLRAGYHEFRDPNTGAISYIRRLGADFYPRFHVYLADMAVSVSVSLHLDQKKPSYGGGTRAHGGEYEGEVVEREAERLKTFVIKMEKPQAKKPENKKGLLRRMFGK